MFFLNKNYQLMVILSMVTFVGVIYVTFVIFNLKKSLYNSLNKFVKTFGEEKQNIINTFKLPIIMIKKSGEIIWYNLVFRKNILKDNDIFGENIDVIIKDFNMDLIFNNIMKKVSYKNKVYEIYPSILKSPQDEKDNTFIIYFIDITQLDILEKKYEMNRPVVSIINIDNYEDVVTNNSSEVKNKILNNIETIINNYFASNGKGIVKKVEKDLFIAIQESKYISEMIVEKFSILDKIRGISQDPKGSVTLSIGVGYDSGEICESEQFAKQALDMALGRGGDQVVIKRKDNFDFFGGISTGTVKNTKVKARIVATSLIELIEDSENVIIMGHKFADLDCLGAAIGMAKGVKLINKDKEVHIVINKEKNLASALLDKVLPSYKYDIFISPNEAGDYIMKQTLLIIVDTHIKNFLESIEVYQSCRQVVIIDHHRKVVEHINDAVIFYHEPSLSSASEMVTELLPYFNSKKSISKIEANALLSGIMLDTRNFVIKTGVRTFEAAAYLKRLGADTIEVRKLFSSSMDAYQKKTRLVSSSDIYKRYAISYEASSSEDLRVIAAQAADELLTINDVDASFIIYKYEDKVIISARSMGSINVQIIMEYMGGGGHFTMAGAQIKNSSIEVVKKQLIESIDRYENSII